MRSNQFTVVIPTRERCDTLLYTLKTCIAQNYDDLTILVSDNNSTDNTREVVHSFHDKRIKYINTGRRVQMSQNWEFALRHVDSGYVMYMGDDDGLLLDSIEEMNAVMNEFLTRGVTWRKIEYCWPDHIVDHHKNVLRMSLSSRGARYRGSSRLKKLLTFTIGYDELPCLYNSFVDVALIQEIKKRSNGLFFHSAIPDVYSGIVLAKFIGEYLSSQRPFSISGASRHSIGTSQMLPHVNESASHRFNNELTATTFDAGLVMCPSPLVIVADSLLKAQQAFPSQQDDFAFDMSRLLHEIMRQAAGGVHEQYSLTKNAVHRMCDMHKLHALRDKLDQYVHVPPSEAVRYGLDMKHQTLTVDGSLLGINTVYDASKVCTHILQQTKVSANQRVGSDLLRRLRKMFRLRATS